MYNSILIGVDEIFLKSEKVKKSLMKLLKENIKQIIKTEKISIGRGRIFLYEYKENWIENLKKVFGIKTIYPALKIQTSIEKIKTFSEKFFENFNGTFKISCKRVWKNFKLTSIEVNKIVGEHISKKFNLKVDLKNPEKTLFIEVHKKESFLYDKVIYGPGGFPLGSQGKVLLLFSGGNDSSAASYMLGKRGLDLDFLFINLADKEFLVYIQRIFEKIKEYFPNSKLFVYDFDIKKLLNVKKGYKQILFKAIAYKIAEAFAKSKNYDAIATGESLAQVSSQTLKSLKVLDSLIKIPVLRPFIAFNKDEIIKLSKELEFFELRAPEICELENNPVTKPRLTTVLNELEKLSIDFENEIIKIYELEGYSSSNLTRNVLKNLENLIIVDIKDISKTKFEKSKKYLIVCPTGIISRKIANELIKEGYEAYYASYKEIKEILE